MKYKLAGFVIGAIATILIVVLGVPAVHAAEFTTSNQAATAGIQKIPAHFATTTGGSGRIRAEGIGPTIQLPVVYMGWGWSFDTQSWNFILQGQADMLSGDVVVRYDGLAVEEFAPSQHFVLGGAPIYGFGVPNANFTFETTTPLLSDRDYDVSVDFPIGYGFILTAEAAGVHPQPLVFVTSNCSVTGGQHVLTLNVYPLGHLLPPTLPVTVDGNPLGTANLISPPPGAVLGSRMGTYSLVISDAEEMSVLTMIQQKAAAGNGNSVMLDVTAPDFTPLPFEAGASIFQDFNCKG